MIFVGDISVPRKDHADRLATVINTNQSIFANKNLVVNLEGLVSDDTDILESTEPIIYNHSHTVQALCKNNNLIALLANNHTLDLAENFQLTKELLVHHKVSFTGAGESKPEAEKPLFLKEDGVEIILLNYCWDFLLYHQHNPSSDVWVSVYNEKKIISNIKRLREEYPNHRIVIYFHWSFDLETLPFPAYRTLSRELIDNGANLIIGCHSHCVQGGEIYKDCGIIYGLGNFYFPNGVYVNKKLKFPKWANENLVIEWNAKTNELICHWFEISGEGSDYNISYSNSESFEKGDKIIKYSPFRNMDESAYLKYFAKNRRKKTLIPIFKSHEDYLTNKIKLSFLKARAKIARSLAKAKIIKWQN